MTAQTILPANSVTGGYEVSNSLRFNSGSSDALNITPSAGNRRTWTWSAWVKRSNLGGEQNLLAANNNNRICFETVDQADQFALTDTNTSTIDVVTDQVFRDVSAWYHLVVAFDSTQGTAANRVKLYVNGSQVTSLARTTYPTQDAQFSINNNSAQYIGRNSGGSNYFNGYMSEVVFIDGQQLAADQFGEFDADSNIWKPIDVSGLTFGTNGFYLETKQSGTSQNSSGLGADTSGNDNHFVVANLTALDQSTDTCTNNFAVLENHSSDDLTLSEGRLKFENPSGGHRMVTSTIAPSQGKWYAEIKMTTEAQQTRVGIIDPEKVKYNTYFHNAGRGYAYKGEDGTIRFNDGTTDGDYGDTYTTGDTIGIAMDLDNHKLYFSKNGTFQNSGDPTSGATGTGAAPAIATGVFYSFGASTQDASGTNPVIEFNFGSPSFAISSGNADGGGLGNFEFAVPSGYFALCTKNLAEYG